MQAHFANRRPVVAVISESQEIGGAELSISALVAGLDTSFDIVGVLAMDSAAETRRRFAEASAHIRTVRGLRRYCTPAGFARLTRVLRSIEPDLIHISCTDQGGALGPLLASKLVKAPSIATLHLVSPGRRRWREAISGFALGLPDERIAVSESVNEYLAGHGLDSTVVLNGVAPQKQRPDARRILGIPPDATAVVGGIGRLHEQKGWDVLCRAAAIVRRDTPGAHFVIVGEGPEREALEAVHECGEVHLAGAVEDAAALIEAFDIFVIPSRWEGFGRVAVEAMLVGVPVVASDVGGLPEVLGDTGILFEVDDAEALAAAIARLVASPNLRAGLGERGRRRAATLFANERMVEEVGDVYRTVLGDRPLMG